MKEEKKQKDMKMSVPVDYCFISLGLSRIYSFVYVMPKSFTAKKPGFVN